MQARTKFEYLNISFWTVKKIFGFCKFPFVKVSLFRVILVRPQFPAFGLNTERYGVYLRIQSECGKVRTTITSNADTFYAVFRYFKVKVVSYFQFWLVMELCWVVFWLTGTRRRVAFEICIQNSCPIKKSPKEASKPVG